MTNDIILDSGETDEVTIYTTKVEEAKANQLAIIVPPQTSQNYTFGPKDPIMVNLLRIQTRFNVDGRIKQADRSKLRNLFKKGTTMSLTYGSDVYSGTNAAGAGAGMLIEKMTITEIPEDRDTPDHYTVKITFVEGVNFA